MAFWGAPLIVGKPAIRAARSALEGLKRIQALNEIWTEADRPALHTRIGIHMGEAIVGNLGYEERINYTALGDTVNIGARLVSANKVFGTSILVSDIVYAQLKDRFLLRMVDHVILKGKAKSLIIYELLAEKGELVPFDLDAYQKAFSQGFAAYQASHWREAIEQFKACRKIYPADTLATVFIDRCKQFKVTPPDAEWRGIWYISEK